MKNTLITSCSEVKETTIHNNDCCSLRADDAVVKAIDLLYMHPNGCESHRKL